MKILKIPFISKPKAETKSKGFAKYLFDEENGSILEQWCELIEGSEFRGKKLNKKSGKYYGLDFDQSYINFRKQIMESDLVTEKLSKEKLKIINNYFFENLTTFLNFDKYATGSNPSGSEADKVRSPYIILGGKYNQLLFINFFKKIQKGRGKTNLRKSGVFEEIDLEKYFELFPEIGNKFFEFNKILFTALNSEKENLETEKIDLGEEKNDFIDLILDENYMIGENEEKIKEKRISILRRIFKSRLKSLKYSDHIYGKLPQDMCEAAHIFPVYEIKKLDLEEWRMIADENNGLNLPIQIHRLYDSKKIIFNENGEVIFLNKKYKEYLSEIFNFKKLNLQKSILNKERKKYIEMYNEKLKT
ncbi:hypothetical protein BKN14_04245 [Candidatus Gracilibacteria bacterium HOT-871]|nr:hypothetical protein BKN14_04245 [Candidatus Gracilibacteria bacterium HOT-871]